MNFQHEEKRCQYSYLIIYCIIIAIISHCIIILLLEIFSETGRTSIITNSNNIKRRMKHCNRKIIEVLSCQ